MILRLMFAKTLLLFFLLTQNTLGQTPDSLKLQLAQAINPVQKAEIAQKIGDKYLRNQSDSSRKYLELALNLSSQSADKRLQARTYHLMSMLHRNLNHFDESLQFSQKALDLYGKIKDKSGLGKVYASLGLVYKKMADVQKIEVFTRKGLEFTLKSIELLKTVDEPEAISWSYNNLGIIYRDLKEFPKAKEAYITGLANARRRNVGDVGTLYGNLGQIYIDFDKNYDTAIEHLQKALFIHKKYQNRQGEEHAYRNMAQAYRGKKDFKQAVSYAQKSLEIAQQLKDVHRLFNSYQVLYSVQEDAGLYKEALTSLKRHKQFEDSTLRLEKTKAITEIETKYETEKKEIQIKLLNEKNRDQYRQLLGAGVGVIVLLVFLGALAWQFQRIRENRGQIQKQSEELKLMMKELHHRVKNNLAIVSSLLKIQSNKLADEKAVEAVRQGQQRVEAMALIHRRLYQSDKITNVNIKEYISDLAAGLMNAYDYSPNAFDLQLTVDKEEMDVDLAISLGLIINEILTNAFKYAYTETKNPFLKIDLKNGQELQLDIQDNGIGIDLERWKTAKDSFGKKLVAGLTKQIGGTFTVENHNGTHFTLSIPAEKLKTAA